MFFFDPLYALVMVLSLALSLGAQAWVVAAIRSQANVRLRSGLSGAEVANIVLQNSGLAGVRLEDSGGWSASR